MWRWISARLWHVTAVSAEDRVKLMIGLVRSDLLVFYREWDATHGDRKITRVPDLQKSKLGSSSEPMLKYKAMETFGLCLYLADRIGKHTALVEQGAQVWEAGRALLRLVELMKSQPAQVSESAHEEMRHKTMRIPTYRSRPGGRHQSMLWAGPCSCHFLRTRARPGNLGTRARPGNLETHARLGNLGTRARPGNLGTRVRP